MNDVRALFGMEKRIANGTMLGELIVFVFNCLQHFLRPTEINTKMCVVISRLFGTKCDKCGSSFSKNDFVMRAKTKIYHIDCFRCSACARQLVPGKRYLLQPLIATMIFIRFVACYLVFQVMSLHCVKEALSIVKMITMYWKNRHKVAFHQSLKATITQT